MGMYLGRFSYTVDALRALIADPQDRSKAAAAAAESLGGKMHGFWYAFGEFDGYFLMEMDDDAGAAALAVTVAAGGALSKLETVPLMSVEDGIEAFRRAGSASYSPPGG